MSKLAIDIHDLHKSYNNLPVLNGINLTVESGTIFALLGPNGAGKTTMLRIITTLLKPDSGTILIEGIDPVKFPNKVKQLIGIVGQYASVDQQLTGFENLKMLGKLYHLSTPEAEKTALMLLEKFKLMDAAHRLVDEYSGGMRRRLDLAASLIGKPKVLFLDEPTTGLDPESREILWDILRDLASKKTTLFLTTQYLEEADKLADKIAIINHGKIIVCDTAQQLKSQISEEYFSIILPDASHIDYVKNNLKGVTFHLDEKLKTIHFPISNDINGIYQLRNILDTIIKNSIPVQHFNVHRPTLDDVFMALTKSKL